MLLEVSLWQARETSREGGRGGGGSGSQSVS